MQEIGAAMDALGSSGDAAAGAGDPKRGTQAVVDYLNANGGIAGREIVPVYRQYNTAAMTSRSSRDQEIQSACSYFTEDNQVFAWLTGPVAAYDANTDCSQRTNMPLITGTAGYAYPDSQISQLQNLWYSTGFLAVPRERTVVDGLWAQGFFPKDARVGLVIEDSPGPRLSVSTGLKPALAAHGIDVVSEVVVPEATQAPWDNYILQFKSDGVTHVVFGASRFLFYPLVFMTRSAENQQYRPMWGMGSDQMPGSAADIGGAPASQLENVSAVGWYPRVDVLDDSPQSTTGKLCEEILRKAGQNPAAVLTYCESLMLLRTAFDRASELSNAGLGAAMANLAEDFSAVTLIGGRTRYGPGRPDGADVVRDVGWDGGCACFKYKSGTRRRA